METESSDTTLPKELWQAILGAVRDVEAFVPSERASRLQSAVAWVGGGASLLVWLWLAGLALHLAITPVVVTEAVPLMTAEFGRRDALFVVLGVVLVGPIILLASYWLLTFLHRVTTDLLQRRYLRALRPLAPHTVSLASLALLWIFRGELNYGLWVVFREISHAFALAAEYSPTVA